MPRHISAMSVDSETKATSIWGTVLSVVRLCYELCFPVASLVALSLSPLCTPSEEYMPTMQCY
eukprot:618112-Amphidinium_carterae.1